MNFRLELPDFEGKRREIAIDVAGVLLRASGKGVAVADAGGDTRGAELCRQSEARLVIQPR